MDTRWPYNTRLEGKILFNRKIYSFCELLDGQKVLDLSYSILKKFQIVLDLSYSGAMNRVNFGRSSKKKTYAPRL